jgi:hypothetical protein
LRGFVVPPAKVISCNRETWTDGPREGALEAFIVVEDIAAGRVAIADMNLAGMGDNAFHPERITRNDEIVAAQVPGLNGQGVEREEEPAVIVGPWHLVQEGHCGAFFDVVGETLGVRKNREDVRFRKHIPKQLCDPFTAAIVQKPVMHDRYAHLSDPVVKFCSRKRRIPRSSTGTNVLSTH